MVAHCHKQVKIQLAAKLHFHLHGSTSLERLAASDDESQVMSAQSRIRVRSVIVRKPSRSQDHISRNANLKALLAECKTLQIFQAVLLGSAVDNRIPENNLSHAGMEDGCLTRSAATIVMGVMGVLKVPRVTALAMKQAWIVVALV